ncbi:MAG TPA: iron-sulfur cluster assembly scaffold protein [bacterium]|nr:iron-sulfur cluster assembly scaffold protein [bacterium]
MSAADESGGGKPAYEGPVLYYTEAVIDHFTNPRNVGEMADDEANGYACIGDPGCGDEMKLWIAVRDARISKISFKSYGCPGAISTSSMLTVLADGKTLDEATCITDDDVIKALGGIPANKQHCSLLGVRALQAAIADYSRRKGQA